MFDALTSVMGPARGTIRRPGELLLWRVYLGSSSLFVDGISLRPWGALRHRLLLPVARTARLLVGRIVFTAYRRSHDSVGDPTFSRRRAKHELSDPETAATSPDIRSTTQGESGTRVIIVHGTMSCSVPIAARFRNDRPAGLFRRYEHDTWLPVAQNATELAEEILARENLSRVILVGHSRGGLVARHAAEIVAERNRGRRKKPALELITFGSPFQGSPLVTTARAGPLLLAAKAWLGAMMGTDASVPVQDRITRTLSLLIWQSGLPDGIGDQKPDSSYLSLLRLHSLVPLETFAGEYPPDPTLDGYFFLEGAQPTFEGAPNDLVVSVASATVGTGKTVPVSHFAYFTNDEVMEAIAQRTVGIGDQPNVVLSSDPDRLTW